MAPIQMAVSKTDQYPNLVATDTESNGRVNTIFLRLIIFRVCQCRSLFMCGGLKETFPIHCSLGGAVCHSEFGGTPMLKLWKRVNIK